MEDVKVTKRDYYNAIISAMQTGETPIAPDDVIAFCEKELAALDKKAAKAKELAAKKRAENDTLLDAVADALSDEFEPIATITERVDADEVTVGKVTYRLTQLVKAGIAEKGEVTIGEGDTKRKATAYKRIIAD